MERVREERRRDRKCADLDFEDKQTETGAEATSNCWIRMACAVSLEYSLNIKSTMYKRRISSCPQTSTLAVSDCSAMDRSTSLSLSACFSLARSLSVSISPFVSFSLSESHLD
eukprot:64688-Rhodomonas_salina.4